MSSSLLQNKLKSEVACLRVDERALDLRAEVLDKVRQAMELAGWRKHITEGAAVSIKPNLCLDELMPGHITSPWVLEGVVLTIRDYASKIYVVEADTWTTDANRGVRIAGLYPLILKYGLQWINLTQSPCVTRKLPGALVLKETLVPEILTQTELISVPVLKTHGNTQFSGAVKNQWGCLKKIRIDYHEHVHETLVDVNRLFRPKFSVLDGTVGCDGKGPKQGIPRVCNWVLASGDNVALDSIGVKLIGGDPSQMKFLTLNEKYGQGNCDLKNINVLGGDISGENLHFALGKRALITSADLFLRKPFLKHLFYRTFLFRILVWAARKNYPFWFFYQGNRLRDTILKNSPYGIQWNRSRQPGDPNAACLICKSKNNETWLVDYEILRLTDNIYSVLRCGRCGFKFVHPKPDAGEQAQFYGKGFYLLPEKKEGRQHLLHRLEKFFCRLRGRLITKFVETPGSLLDIGCGNGAFLAEMAEKGWRAQGIDASEESCRIAGERTGAHIFYGEPAEFDPKGTKFDAITLWHVLEHVEAPDALLRKIYGLLSEKGILAINVPHGGGISLFLKTRWAFLDLPRHLYHFSAKHLRILLERNGFRVKREKFFSLEYSPLILLLNFLNLVTARPMYFYYWIKRKNWGKLRLSPLEHFYNFTASLLGIAVFAAPAFVLSFLLALFRAGDNLTVIAEKAERS